MTNKIVTVLIGVLLVLGLALAACAPTTTPPVTPPVTAPVTPPVTPPEPPTPPPPPPPTGNAPPVFEPTWAYKEYTDPTYGFTVKYPDDWVPRADMMTTPYHVAVFSVDAFVPGIAIMAFDADAPEGDAWIKNSVSLVKGTSPKLLSAITPALTPDGSAAYVYKIGYIASSGYAAEGYVKDVDRAAKRIRFMVYTVTEFEPFNEAKFKEIADTIVFK